MSTTRPDAVPFAGLRRNAVALVGGLLIVLAIFVFVPDIAPRPSGLPPVQLVHGKILELLPSTDPGTPDVRIRVVDGIADGPKTGDVVEGFLQGPNGLEARPDFDVGDDVIINISTDPQAGFVAVNDRYRIPTLALLVGLFALAVTVVGGWRGVRSLIALALSLSVVVKVVVPLILAGWEPAGVAIVAATGVTSRRSCSRRAPGARPSRRPSGRPRHSRSSRSWPSSSTNWPSSRPCAAPRRPAT